MELKRASRKQTKIKLLLSGPSGSGKTYSALLLASGMVPWEKIAVIDTERGSADLYSDLGPYNTVTLEAPFPPEKYIDAINLCLSKGMEFIIIDSISHEWDGVGGCLEIHANMTGNNSYTNWNKVTPRHNKFIDVILQCPVYVIATGRSKQDYTLQTKDGKQVPEKVGLKTVTREGFDYEVTIQFEIDINHNATAVKDRTKLFEKLFPEPITPIVGTRIKEWIASGAPMEPTPFETYNQRISSAKTVDELTAVSNDIMNDKNLSEYQHDALRTAFRNNEVFKSNKNVFVKKPQKENSSAGNKENGNKPADKKTEPAKQGGKNDSPGAKTNVRIPDVGTLGQYKKFMEDIKDTNNEFSLDVLITDIEGTDGFTQRQVDALKKLIESKRRVILADEAKNNPPASETNGTDKKFAGTDSNNFLKKGMGKDGGKN